MEKPEKKVGYRVEEFDGDVIAKQCGYLGQAKFIQGYNESHTEQEAYRDELLMGLAGVYSKMSFTMGKHQDSGIELLVVSEVDHNRFATPLEEALYLLAKELGWKA